MEIIASSQFIRIGPRKMKLVADAVKAQAPLAAIEQLKFFNKRAAQYLIKVLSQAVSNAKNNFQKKPENLIIKQILINEGPRLKRLDKSHGARFDRGRRQKRMSHIKIILSEKTQEKMENKNAKIKNKNDR